MVETASLWVARLSVRELTAQEKGELQNWLDSDPRHHELFTQLQRVDADLGAVAALSTLDPTLIPAGLRSAVDDSRELQIHYQRRGSLRRLSVVLGVAAACSFLLLGVGAYLSLFSTEGVTEAASYATAVGEQREVLLADGTIVSVNTSSSLSVAYSDSMRTVHLKDGEAFFQVAKDSERPFVVYVGDEVVEAVGTSFAVYYRDQLTRVSVVEGTVAFGGTPGQGVHDIYRQDGRGNVLAQRVDHGQTLTMRDGEAYGRVYQDSAIRNVASWRYGTLHFDGATLADIVAELSYYLPQRVVIVDEEISSYRGSGVFRIDDAQSIFAAFEVAWPVKIEYQTSNVVLLHAEN